VLNFVKSAISAATLAKLTPLKDIHSGMEQLKEHFDDETIEKINQLCLKDFDKLASSDFSSVSVSARSKYVAFLPLPSNEDNVDFLTLTAEFAIEKKDILINLVGRIEDVLDENSLNSDVLLESLSLSSEDKLSVRTFTIPTKFKSVLLEFDNSKSLFTSKQIKYKTHLAI
jgi:hypothetical protein